MMDKKKGFLFMLCICLVLTGFPGKGLLHGETTIPQITLLGKWGSGPYEDAAVRGEYAYCLSGSGLDVLDISDPSNPVKTGDCPTMDNSRNICLHENYVYITIRNFYRNEGGLQVIDITDPYAPFSTGYIETGSTYDVDVSGHYAYIVTQDTGLVIIDIGNPSSPVNVGTYFTSDKVSDVAVNGNYAYMLNRSGLKIIDVSNPSAPSLAGDYQMTYKAYDVLDIVVRGDYAYVAGVHFGLWIFDISNPDNPVIVGRYDRNMTYGVEINGNNAYLYGDYGFEILDVGNRSMPVLMGEFDMSSPGILGLSIDTNGNYAFAANSEEGLKVFDISNPDSPTLVGSYGDITEGISDITTRGQYAYMAEKKGLFIIDLTNPAYPKLEGKIRTTYITTNNIDVNGSYAYITDISGMSVIDITEPSFPEAIGRYSSNVVYESYNLHGIKVKGNYAYTTRSYYSFLVIDVSNPGDPQLAGSNSDCQHGNIAIRDQYAYVAARHTLDILDISNPRSPLRVGVLPNVFWADDVAVKGNHAYVTWESGLAIVDITAPASPVKIGNINFTTPTKGIFIKNNHLYVALPGKGFQVFDITVPSSPLPVFFYRVPGGARDVHIDGNYIYVRNSRLYVYWSGDIPVWVTSPAGTDTWPVGSPQTITWTTNTNIQSMDGNADIGLYRGNVKIGTIAENILLTDGNYSWRVGMFVEGSRFLKPGKQYQVGIRTAENNYLALSDGHFTVPSTGVTVSLQAERKEEKLWLIKKFYGKLNIRVEKETSALAVEKYLIKRKENDGQYRVIGEFQDVELDGNSYTFFDTFVLESRWYYYYIEAVDTTGVVIAESDTHIFYPTGGVILSNGNS